MTTFHTLRRLAAILLAAVLVTTAFAAPASAQNGSPQNPFVITTAPYAITQSGYYILGKNINYSGTSGNIITISASNVTLDFNTFYIAGPVGNAGQGVYGINANEQSNITIKNGTIAYCYFGIYLNGNGTQTTNSVGHRIDTMRVTYCTYVGIDVTAGPSSVITDCQVSKITGSTSTANGYGIYLLGDGATVVNCSVGGIAAPTGTNYGISIGGGAFATRNRISAATDGVYSNGGKYQDNVTLNCTTPFSGSGDAGGNN